MKKIIIATALSSAALFATTSIALADEHRAQAAVQVGAGISVGHTLDTGEKAESSTGSQDSDNQAEDASDSNDQETNASGSANLSPHENDGEHAQKGATSTASRGQDKDAENADSNGHGSDGTDRKGGLNFHAFIQWLFGQPGTTTINDIKAHVSANASTSASTTADVGGRGFFQNLLRMIFGGND